MGCSDYPCSAAQAQVASSSEASAGRRYHYQVASHGPGEAAAAGPGPGPGPCYFASVVRCQRRSGPGARVRRGTVALWHRQARVHPSLPRVGLPANAGGRGLPGASGRGAAAPGPRPPQTLASEVVTSRSKGPLGPSLAFKFTVTLSHRPPAGSENAQCQ